MTSTPLNHAPDASGASWHSTLPEFIKSLVPLSPQEAAVALNTRLLAEESKGQAYFDRMLAQAEQVVTTLQVPTMWRRALQEELLLAREYEVTKPIIPSVPVATTLLEAMTSGRLDRVFDSLMSAPFNLVPLLAEQALREHKVNAADEWEGVRFLDALLHLNDQGTRNVDNQHVLREWGAGAKGREDQQAQEQLLPERKQVVTEADRPRLTQRRQQLLEHWQSTSSTQVQASIQLIEQRLAELDAVHSEPIINETAVDTTDLAVPHIEFTARRVVLLHIFNCKPPIRLDDRTHELGRSYGFRNGRNIYDHYVKLSKPTGITGMEGKELPSIISDIKAVLPLVEDRYKKDACDKLNELTIKQV
jgi:hypothetical protein